MAEREQEVADLANQLIDTFVERGSCDFSTEFALPFPSVVFLRLMGLPTDRLDEFVKAKEGMIRPVGETEADRQAMRMETGAWIFEYFSSALDAHAENDTSDVLGTFLALEQEGRLTRDETLNICLLMLAAGLDTVTDTLECSFAFLAQNPAHQRQLADDPDLAAGAVEELLRFETPVPTVARIAMAATEIDGCPVAAGERVRPILAVANIDPDVHGDPDAVDFARPSNKHLAFGAGVHRCVGSHLARLELRVALREWHRRIPSYRLADGHVVTSRGSARSSTCRSSSAGGASRGVSTGAHESSAISQYWHHQSTPTRILSFSCQQNAKSARGLEVVVAVTAAVALERRAAKGGQLDHPLRLFERRLVDGGLVAHAPLAGAARPPRRHGSALRPRKSALGLYSMPDRARARCRASSS